MLINQIKLNGNSAQEQLKMQIDLLKQDLKTTTENIDKLKERLESLEGVTGFDALEDIEDGDKLVTDTVENVINPFSMK